MPTPIWKYAAISAISLLIGMVTGEYNPNRNIVTADQMSAQYNMILQTLGDMKTEQSDLKNMVYDMRGQLRGEREFKASQ